MLSGVPGADVVVMVKVAARSVAVLAEHQNAGAPVPLSRLGASVIT